MEALNKENLPYHLHEQPSPSAGLLLPEIREGSDSRPNLPESLPPTGGTAGHRLERPNQRSDAGRRWS